MKSIKPLGTIKNLKERDLIVAKKTSELCPQLDKDWLNYLGETFFQSESTTRDFHIGIPDFDTRHIMYLTWLASILLCCGRGNYLSAHEILQQAIAELEVEMLEEASA
jgi:hypothetical protein